MQMQEAAFVRDGVDRLEQDGIIRARRALEISLVRSMLGEMLRQPREPSNVIAGVNLQYCLQLMAQQPNTVPAILTSDFFFTQPGSQHFVTEASQVDEDTLYYSMQHVLEVLLRGAFAARARVRHALPPAFNVELDQHFAVLWLMLSLPVQSAEMMCTDPNNKVAYAGEWHAFCRAIRVCYQDVYIHRAESRNNWTCANFELTRSAQLRLPSEDEFTTLAAAFDISTASKKRNALIIMQRILCMIVGKKLPHM